MGSQRWRKRHDDVQELTDFVYDGEKVAEEIDYDAANQATYTHAGSSIYSPLLAQRTGGTSGWFLQDALGSTLGLLDADEALLLQVMYDAWGNELLATGAGATPYRYVGAYGYYRDVETDLLYLWHRYYDPRVGRFTRRDPLDPSVEAYPYLRNLPTYRTDPRGTVIGLLCAGMCADVLISVGVAVALCKRLQRKYPGAEEDLWGCVRDLLFGKEGENPINKVGNAAFVAAALTCLGCLMRRVKVPKCPSWQDILVKRLTAGMLCALICGFFNNALPLCPHREEQPH